MILSLSYCHKIFTNDWRNIEVCQNVGFSEIDFTMTAKNFKIDKRLILRDLDQLKKIQH